MSNYRQCKAFLINAFLALDDEAPEDERLRRAIEQVLEAVARTERDAIMSQPERYPKSPKTGNVVNLPR